MPRGFNSIEKEHIKEKLMAAGRELFSTAGLKKTSIKDLTEKAGIAQGTFYIFFDSKEVLYFLLMEQDEAEIKETVLNNFRSLKQIKASDFADIIFTTVKQLENYPLIHRLYTTDELAVLMRKLPNKILKEHGDMDVLSFHPLLEKWKGDGLIDANTSNEIVTGALRGFFLMTIHKREIGEDIYEQSLRFLAEGIALKLFEGGEKS